MDAYDFDALARRISTRRTALSGALAFLLSPATAPARDKRKHRKRKRERRQSACASCPDPCWRSGTCIPSKGSNVSRCDLAESTAFSGLDCTGCNASRANLSGADLRGATFTRANLSGSCLVDANFSGAIIAKNTNLANAIFCRTTMPNGSVNNSGCNAGSDCCPTACVPRCRGKVCGGADGCGGTCLTGTCPVGQGCNAGMCVPVQGTCPTGADSCGGSGVVTCNSSQCQCNITTEGATVCSTEYELPGSGGTCEGCQTSADCTSEYPTILGVFCVATNGTTCCNGTAGGFCSAPCGAY